METKYPIPEDPKDVPDIIRLITNPPTPRGGYSTFGFTVWANKVLYNPPEPRDKVILSIHYLICVVPNIPPGKRIYDFESMVPITLDNYPDDENITMLILQLARSMIGDPSWKKGLLEQGIVDRAVAAVRRFPGSRGVNGTGRGLLKSLGSLPDQFK